MVDLDTNFAAREDPSSPRTCGFTPSCPYPWLDLLDAEFISNGVEQKPTRYTLLFLSPSLTPPWPTRLLDIFPIESRWGFDEQISPTVLGSCGSISPIGTSKANNSQGHRPILEVNIKLD
ncbi:hypothetical protein TNCV_2303461 [Trichonephila clavipes]|nr:hypothetical protein TNCV_2303461 [Trichonephila clavipes]